MARIKDAIIDAQNEFNDLDYGYDVLRDIQAYAQIDPMHYAESEVEVE